MTRYAAELYIQFVYSLELSYDELLELEAELKLAVAGILEENTGEFMHFEGMGDTMRTQCVFLEYKEALFHAVCDALAPLMDGRVEARLLFVNKDLDGVHFYAVSRGAWRECGMALPPAGPLAAALREQDPEG